MTAGTRLRSVKRSLAPAALAAALAPALSTSAAAQTDYAADVRFAIDAIEKECAALLQSKGIDWRAVAAPFLAEAADVTSPSEHAWQLQRLLARLQDGHAAVQPQPAAGELTWPIPETTGVGMFWCLVDDEIYVKNVWNEAAKMGLQPGMHVLEVAGQPAAAWLERRIAELSDFICFSSPQHARFYASHLGLAEPQGTRLPIVLGKSKGKKTERELVYVRANPNYWGPAFPPEDTKAVDDGGDVSYGTAGKKWGYVHVRRCPGELPELMDAALAEVGKSKGLILDFRGNSGGGFDHDAFMGRFIPAGKTFSSGREFASAGPNPYGGPVVAIVDGSVRSAGETAAGLFRYDGRGYVIGESPTAGMSSQKTTIELPSGLFHLHVSTHTNMSRYNDGKGLEGIGVIPHRIVAFDPDDLADEVDTLIRVAAEILAKFPQKEVPYDPKDFGWKK
jgi:hypothetical protein